MSTSSSGLFEWEYGRNGHSSVAILTILHPLSACHVNDYDSQFSKALDELNATGSSGVSYVDISNLSSVVKELKNLEISILSVLRIISKNEVKRLIVSNIHCDQIRGHVAQYFYKIFKESHGCRLSLDFGSISLKDLVFPKKLLAKIVTGALKDNEVVTLNTLQDIVEQDDVPEALISAVHKAYKAICTKYKKKSKPWFKNKNSLKDDCRNKQFDRKSSIPHCSNICGFGDLHTNGESNLFTSHKKTTKCYICRQLYSFPKRCDKINDARRHYMKLCQNCADFNWGRRFQSVDLTGRYALVTGGRIKIGFEVALMLLRDGCNVVVTTRFPRDATLRYMRVKDFHQWKTRLKIFPVDFKDNQGIYNLISYLKRNLPHLDILINNAAQTISRPLEFYHHILPYEKAAYNTLDPSQQQLLAVPDALNCVSSIMEPFNNQDNYSPVLNSKNVDYSQVTKRMRMHNDKELTTPDTNEMICKQKLKRSQSCEIMRNPVSKTPKLIRSVSEEFLSSYGQSSKVTSHQSDSLSPKISSCFPVGLVDDDGQQIDLRRHTSWKATIEQIPIAELLEVLTINTVAPFILCQELKPLLQASPANRRFIVNVSAMEGQFNRFAKTKFHPHTNMAKAALNMMTRTAAIGYASDNIYMTSVDTGWVTDERPLHQVAQERKTKGFTLPLDCVDGAARIYDPIVHGIISDDIPYFAVFLKDYKPFAW